METLIERLPEIINAAAQSYLGILALFSIALSALAYVFFAKASETVKVVIFVLLFIGVIGFGAAMFRAGESGGPHAASKSELSEEARTLLMGAAADPSGMVFYEKYGAGVDLHTNGTSLLTDKFDHRAVATWESALRELLEKELLIERGESGEIYEITKHGYDVAEKL